MHLPLSLRWNEARNKRRTLWLYAALVLVAVLTLWGVSELLRQFLSFWTLLNNAEGRRLAWSTLRTVVSTIGATAAICGGLLASWSVTTKHVWRIPDRYRQAIESLRDEQLENRLAGIYTLEQIAKVLARDYWTITRILTSFVQERSPIYQRGKILLKSALHEQQAIASDIQAALTVIGRRSIIHRVLLRVMNKAPRDEQINIGLTNLYKARLHKANLQEANLYRANLQEANLSRANLQKADLQGANLQEANLYKANLQQGSLQTANLQQAFLSNANLQRANLYQANLQGANLQGANLQKVSFQEANLQGVHLQAASLQEAFLPNADLRKANLYQANLQGAFLPHANLQGANLQEASLRGVTGLTDTQLSQATLYKTILPDGSISDREDNHEPGERSQRVELAHTRFTKSIR